MYDVVIEGGQIVDAQGIRAATIAIRGERIADVLPPGSPVTGRQMIDARGLHVLPGLIDTHVHLRDPARPDRETFETGTAAAAAGGVTTICEMPTSDPPVNTAQRLRARAETVAPRAIVDYCLYAGAGSENLEHVEGLAAAGAVAFKTWLHSPATGREKEFVGLACPSMTALPDVMKAVARTGKVHALHCEDDGVLASAEAAARQAGGSPGEVYGAARPMTAEDTSVAKALAIASAVGARVQVVHMSSPAAVRLVDAARREGMAVSAETCPHYLTLTDEALIRFGPFAKCNPPLRSPETVEALWECLRAGAIDVIGTDHCPYLPQELEAGHEDIFASPPGLPGLETMLPTLLTAVHDGRLTLPQLVSLTSARAAELFDLPYKGRLESGADADLAVVDLGAQWTFDPAVTFSKAGKNARFLEGKCFTGKLRSTWLRGQLIFADGQLVARPGAGRFITPGPRG